MINQKWLNERYEYDPKEGLLRSRHKRFAGKPIGSISAKGYIYVKVGGEQHFVHRIIWLMVYGEWPKGQIDHINRIRTDNRLANLRDVSARENCQNLTKNKSGHPGVYRCAGKWRALVKHKGVRLHLGYFDDILEAANAYKETVDALCISERR